MSAQQPPAPHPSSLPTACVTATREPLSQREMGQQDTGTGVKMPRTQLLSLRRSHFFLNKCVQLFCLWGISRALSCLGFHTYDSPSGKLTFGGSIP